MKFLLLLLFVCAAGIGQAQTLLPLYIVDASKRDTVKAVFLCYIDGISPIQKKGYAIRRFGKGSPPADRNGLRPAILIMEMVETGEYLDEKKKPFLLDIWMHKIKNW